MVNRISRRTTLGICVGGVIALVAGASAIAETNGPDANTRAPFTVFTHMIEAHVVAPCSTCAVPALPAGSKVGNEYVDDPVFDQKFGGTQIGQEALVITIVSSDASIALLDGSISFTGGGRSGKLVASGEIDARSSSGVVPITGGTGEFEGAKGELDYSGAGLSSKVDTLTVHLTN